MADYIFCLRKKNNPRMDVRICQKKCEFKEGCPEFIAYQGKTKDNPSILNSELFMPPTLSPMPAKH
jgi:hypothetical protein